MLDLDIHFILSYSLVFLRITGMFFALPFFGDSVVPVQVRILLSLSLALAFGPLVSSSWSVKVTDMGSLEIFTLVIKELFIGIFIGYMSKLLFEGIVMSANLVGYQMGFGTANLLIPGSDLQINAFTGLHRNLILMVFLSLGLHYIFIEAIFESFKNIPAGEAFFHGGIVKGLILKTGAIFKIAMQLASPILIALIFTMAALGLVARTVPQMNVFTLSFPVSFFIGLSVYVSLTLLLPTWLKNHYQKEGLELIHSIFQLKKAQP